MFRRAMGVIALAMVGPATASSSSAQTTQAALPALSAAATHPVRAAKLTPAQLNDLHQQAVEWMKANKPRQARELLDRIWKESPPAGLPRSRALVLNRAIIDLNDDRLAMRAVRNLSDHLIAQKEVDDEVATNILGSALNYAAMDPKVKAQAVWQAGWKEWDRRNQKLDQGRPGFHHWGVKWISDEEYIALRTRQRELENIIGAQQKVVDATLHRIGTINEEITISQYTDAVDSPASIFSPMSPIGLTPSQRLGGGVAGGVGAQRLDRPQYQGLNEFYELHEQAINANAQRRDDLARLDGLLRQRERPEWPTQYDPIDPPAIDPPAIDPGAR